MKIFVVEDEPASIESARMQLGEDHELTFFTTAMEVSDKLFRYLGDGRCQKPDLILTDVNIPMGNPGGASVGDHYSPSDMIPAGLVVALQAVQLRVPCLIITDSNSHCDMIGFLLDDIGNVDKKIPRMVGVHTRPDRIEAPSGMGKDWLGTLKYGGGIKETIKSLITPPEDLMKEEEEEIKKRKEK